MVVGRMTKNIRSTYIVGAWESPIHFRCEFFCTIEAQTRSGGLSLNWTCLLTSNCLQLDCALWLCNSNVPTTGTRTLINLKLWSLLRQMFLLTKNVTNIQFKRTMSAYNYNPYVHTVQVQEKALFLNLSKKWKFSITFHRHIRQLHFSQKKKQK